MANTILSSNMSLPVPVVGVDPGPQYAQDVNNCLTLIDAHNHSPGSGVQVNPAGININSDLPFNANDATLLRSVRFNPNLSPISGAQDIGCLYESGVDLFYNDGNGNQIRITQAGGITGAPGNISGLTPPASVTYNAVSSTFVFESAANTPANIDGASFLFRNLVTNSKALTLSPPNAMSANYNIILPSLPSQTSIMTLDPSGNMAASYTIDGTTLAITANVIGIKNLGVDTAQLAELSVTRAKLAAVGPVISSSTGSNVNSSTVSPAPVVNLSVSFTTDIGSINRPVLIALQSDGANQGNFDVQNAPTVIYVYRNGSPIGAYKAQSGGGTMSLPCSTISFLDTTAVPNTTYTYEIWASTTGTLIVNNIVMVVREL